MVKRKRSRIASKPKSAPPAADAWVSQGGLDPEAKKGTAESPPASPLATANKGKKFPHRLSFDMETAQYKRLKRAAFESDRPMNEILRETVEDWL